jgi:nucleotide-binding universal stress UspA family protein
VGAPAKGYKDMNAMATARPVVVGIDGSGRAEQLLEWALAEALVCQAPLRVVTVWNWDGQASAGPSARRAESSVSRPAGWARQVQETLVARVLARFGKPAPLVISEVTEGDPATQLIQRSCDAELLVVGGDAANREPGARTVAEVCRRHAGCPVVVVPPDSRMPRPVLPHG